MTAWRLLFLLFACGLTAEGSGQTAAPDTLVPQVKFLSLQPAPTFHRQRFWATAGTGTAVYGGLSVALWNAWYKDYPLTGFHTFNDWGEWNDMDKAGHLFSAWTGCHYAFRGARWTGMGRRSAMWTAAGVGMGIMATMEVMDGFSEQYGFSWGDIGFNTLGVALFVSQEVLWQEQRIQMKISCVRPGYPEEPLYSVDGSRSTTLDKRAAGLYGTNFFNLLIKDYNAITEWCSVNVHSFLKNRESSKFPAWLNVAVGYGAGNIYGGFENKWTAADGTVFEPDPDRYPRYRQFYLSPDVDWSKIPTRHKWLKFTLGLFNFLKFPAPAFEMNTLGKAKFHYLHW
ncbi:MAG: DUF2279 domain-containing protein [Bacteroidetes bacterium]|nr:DUF2279 domain-containing protein [Bacteroidota bacterium]